MGSAIALTLLKAGHVVTIWNRTRARTQTLAKQGAVTAEHLENAVAASPLTIMCVTDQAACRAILEQVKVARSLRGKVLVQLTTGTPADARRNSRWARRRDIQYLDGAVMAAPHQIGRDEATILYGGPGITFAAAESTLSALGTALYFSEDAGMPALMDAALIALYYGAVAGFIHGATLVTGEGAELQGFAELAQRFLGTFVAPVLTEIRLRIDRGFYADAQATMNTQIAAMDLLVLRTSRDVGVHTEVMESIRGTFAAAIAAGRGHEDIACLAEILGANASQS
jgi:3-hydroxyisobutyrate dehydrogenase-like beta-hydroxyacid dehydrogenase